MTHLTPQDLGDHGEKIAEEHLSQMGYRILARNWSWRKGELDLIAQQNEEIVFIEVKTRRSKAFGAPEESITHAKREKLVKTAAAYLQDTGLEDSQWRIDVVAIDVDRKGEVLRLEHLVSAIEG